MNSLNMSDSEELISVYNQDHATQTEWLSQCQSIITAHNAKIIQRNAAATLPVLLLKTSNRTKNRAYRKKRYWIADIFQSRLEHGFHHDTFPTLRLEDLRFRNYLRMSVIEFEELLTMVGPAIAKQDVLRAAIPADERLALTLRYLASGDSMTSMSYHYLLGLTTVSNIISDTCGAIWDILSPLVLRPCGKEQWNEIAETFDEICQFPHCIGALDGKHVAIQCPNNGGSSFYNYKGSHSIILLAMCDANYIFRSVDIGARGRQSDGGVFRQSQLFQNLDMSSMDLPTPKPLWEQGPDIPYVIVADEAFPLTTYLLRPYPGKNQLSTEERVYNYRLSRAKRTIENAFGILASQWRIYRKPILASVKNVDNMISATVCLHNWLRRNNMNTHKYISPEMVDRFDEEGRLIEGSWRSELGNGGALQSINNCSSNNHSRTAATLRSNFTEYFNDEGAIPWQFVQIYR